LWAQRVASDWRTISISIRIVVPWAYPRM
jgi:hypothetical protein